MPRYIDADALKQDVGSYNPVKYTYEYGYVITVEDIDSAPTADVQEVKHGKWIMNHCSICYGDISFWLKSNRWCTCNFCPNCGADMREERDNGRFD